MNDTAAGALKRSTAINQEGEKRIAGGVVSLNRKVDPPICFVRAQGMHLWDADGKQYLDYHAAFAPHLLGHNDAGVNQAVHDALDRHWSLMGSGTTTWEIELAGLLCQSVGSLQRVQLTNTGSEATAHAIRLCRAWTGREDILLTLGGYNGWHNDVARAVMPSLDQVGPRVSPGEYPLLPSSAGVPEDVKRRIHVVNFNDLESVEYVLKRHPVACVMTEPVLQNIGVVAPLDGYLKGLLQLCRSHGALLVLDEVKTGFRCALGGYQSLAGLEPDLTVLGKAVANGYPMGVIGGRTDVMGLFHSPDPARRVLIAGTYNAHPVGTAAAIATLIRLQDGSVHARLEALGRRLENGLTEIFAEFGLTTTISRVGSAFCVYFMDHAPRDWHDILLHHDFDLDLRYRRALVERGVYHFPLACKQGSISAAHTETAIDDTLQRTREVLQTL